MTIAATNSPRRKSSLRSRCDSDLRLTSSNGLGSSGTASVFDCATVMTARRTTSRHEDATTDDKEHQCGDQNWWPEQSGPREHFRPYAMDSRGVRFRRLGAWDPRRVPLVRVTGGANRVVIGLGWRLDVKCPLALIDHVTVRLPKDRLQTRNELLGELHFRAPRRWGEEKSGGRACWQCRAGHSVGKSKGVCFQCDAGLPVHTTREH